MPERRQENFQRHYERDQRTNPRVLGLLIILRKEQLKRLGIKQSQKRLWLIEDVILIPLSEPAEQPLFGLIAQ